MKKFPHELYELALGVVLRVLCHQKRCRLRLTMCPWRDLWAALIALLKFLHGSDTSLIRKFDVFALATHAVNILNLFITFGDTFLPSPQSYDDLYYEIIRMYHVFDNLHAMGTTTVNTTTSITKFYHKKIIKVWCLVFVIDYQLNLLKLCNIQLKVSLARELTQCYSDNT